MLRRIENSTQKTEVVKRDLSGRIWVIVLSLLAAVVATQIVVSSALAGRGRELLELEGDKIQLQFENQLLKEELAEKSSLLKLSEKSTELGLRKPDQILYVNLDNPIASLPQ